MPIQAFSTALCTINKKGTFDEKRYSRREADNAPRDSRSCALCRNGFILPGAQILVFDLIALSPLADIGGAAAMHAAQNASGICMLICI
jgi:hypothetical protein